MICLRIKDVAAKRGVTTAYKLQKIAGLHPGHAARLWRGNLTMIGMGTLDALCDSLQCEPGDLLVRLKGKRRRARSKP